MTRHDENLIGLVGRAGSGKDTVAGMLAPLQYERLAFADAMRTAAYESNPYVKTSYATFVRLADVIDQHGWDHAKRRYPDVRRYLQHYGTAMRQQLPGCWVDIVADKTVDLLIDQQRSVVVTDVRFPDEAHMIRARGGLLVRVERPNITSTLGINASHVSETNIDALPTDYTLLNDSDLETLRGRVRALHVEACAHTRRWIEGTS